MLRTLLRSGAPGTVTRAAAILLVAAITACGDGTTAPDADSSRLPSIRGRWEGLLAPYATAEESSPGFLGTLVLDLEMGLDGRLDGTARIRQGFQSGPLLQAEGRFDPPIVQLRLTTEAGETLIVVGESDDFGGVIRATWLVDTVAAYELGSDAGTVQLMKRSTGP